MEVHDGRLSGGILEECSDEPFEIPGDILGNIAAEVLGRNDDTILEIIPGGVLEEIPKGVRISIPTDTIKRVERNP